MCGICGVVVPPGQVPDRQVVQAMTETLDRRGPDAEGFFFEGNVGLGHRRLAVIDTSEAANEPLYNEDGSVAVIFNGEIYNFQTLTRELAERGHRFRTRSDTEVLVHGWEEWGTELPRRLRGMFAFALYDRRAGRLFLCRDRWGKKPLYYTAGPAGFVFGSEIKALLAHPEISRELDLAAIGQYMVYGNTAGDGSVYRQIRRLPPGCSLTLVTGQAGAEPILEHYWGFRPCPRRRFDVGEWLNRLDATIAEAVRLRLVADVPLGAFLSGGIDSSLIVAHMVRLAPGKVQTFCIGFDEAGWDESEHSRAVAEVLGTDHHVERVTPDAAAVLPELVETYDEPFADPSAVPTYYVAKMTRRHVTVALSGDGGDELFAGYQRYLETRNLGYLSRLLTPAGRRLMRRLADAQPPGAYLRRALDRVSRRGFDLYHHALGWSEDHLALLAPEVRRALGEASEQKAAAAYRRYGDLPYLDRCRYTDLVNYLPDQILVKVDRAAMRHSLEVRCPFLDQRVIEMAAEAPMAAQLSWTRQKTLLRQLAYRHVPRRLLDRPKQGFAVPLGRWLREPLAPLVRRMLDDDADPTWRFFDRAEAGRRFELHLADRSDGEKVLWRLLFFSTWATRKLQ